MIDRQHIPFIVFATSMVVALVIALLTGAWPAALAIAVSGCALALALRQPQPENHDTAFLEEDIAEIRAANDAHDGDIATLRTSIDEMAEIVESIAGDIQRLSNAPDSDDIKALRRTVDTLGERVDAVDGPVAQTRTRLDTLERTLTTVQSRLAQDEAPVALKEVEPVALAANGNPGAARVRTATKSASTSGIASITERAGQLRDRLSRPKKSLQVSALPLFDADQTPRSLMIEEPGDHETLEGSIAAIDHALGLIRTSDDPDARIFVRLSHDIVTQSDMATKLEPVIAEHGESLSRLVVLVPQSVLEGGPPKALASLLIAGARFAMERMTDWSADLESLAKRGLTVIAVDGPGMAKSALSQKGDPTRLRQVLHARGITLLAGEIETRMQLDAVRTLQPDLIGGSGLGEATLMDVKA